MMDDFEEELDNDEILNDLEKRIEKLEDLDLRKQLIEFCLTGSGDEVITKEKLYHVLCK